jgi:two-component system, sensor histidine kinase PdtaS
MKKNLQFFSVLIFTLLFCFLSAEASDSLRSSVNINFSSTEGIDSLNRISYKYRTNNPTFAQKTAALAIESATRISYPRGKAKGYLNLGNALLYKGEFNQALNAYSKSFDLAKEMKNPEIAGNAVMGSGIAYMYKGNYKASMSQFLKALKVNEYLKDDRGIANNSNNLGELYRLMGNYKAALKYSCMSLEKEVAMGNDEGIFNSYLNLGSIYGGMNNPDKALFYYLKAFGIKEKVGDKKSLAVNVLNIGMTYDMKDEKDKALESFLQALELFREVEDILGEINSLYNIASIYMDAKNYSAAEKYFNQCHLLALKAESHDWLKDYHYKMAHLKSFQGDYRAAFDHYDQYDNYKDSVYRENLLETVNEAEGDYLMEKKEKEIAILHKEKANLELIEQKSHATRNYLYFGISILVIGGGALFKSYNDKQKLNRKLEIAVKERTSELEEQKKEVELMLKEIHHRVKNNMQLISSMLNLQLFYNPHMSSEEVIDNVKNKIKCMALIHDKLYKAGSFSGLNSREYFTELAGHVKGISGRDSVQINTDVEEHFFPIDTMIPCGLIINELMLNSFKHNENISRIDISFKKLEGKYHLTVTDDGKGLPEDFDTEKLNSLGLSLVSDLAEQIDGKAEFKNARGLQAEIIFS